MDDPPVFEPAFSSARRTRCGGSPDARCPPDRTAGGRIRAPVSAVRAWRVHEYGEPEQALQLDDVPEPVAGPDELPVRVAAATLNLNDRDGVRAPYRTRRPHLPCTP